MKNKQQVVQGISGPVVPINVCFAEDGEVDYAAVRRYGDWLCAQGVPVLMLTYGSSEFACLSDDQGWRLTKELASAVAKRSFFIASTGWWPVERCRQFLRHAEQCGVDAVKIQLNPLLLAGAPSNVTCSCATTRR